MDRPDIGDMMHNIEKAFDTDSPWRMLRQLGWDKANSRFAIALDWRGESGFPEFQHSYRFGPGDECAACGMEFYAEAFGSVKVHREAVGIVEHCNIYDADHRGRCYGCRNAFGQMFTVRELLDAVA